MSDDAESEDKKPRFLQKLAIGASAIAAVPFGCAAGVIGSVMYIPGALVMGLLTRSRVHMVEGMVATTIMGILGMLGHSAYQGVKSKAMELEFLKGDEPVPANVQFTNGSFGVPDNMRALLEGFRKEHKDHPQSRARLADYIKENGGNEVFKFTFSDKKTGGAAEYVLKSSDITTALRHGQFSGVIVTDKDSGSRLQPRDIVAGFDR